MFKNYRTYSLSQGVKTKALAVVQCGSKTCVILHNTVVAEKHGRKITLRNGGWDTPSTRFVINRALSEWCASSALVYRKKHVTYLTQNGVVRPFESGMTLTVRS